MTATDKAESIGENQTERGTAYDVIADWYDASLQSGSPVHALTVPAMLALCRDVAGQTLCDVACGSGHFTRELADRAANVTGVDLSRPLLQRAKAQEAENPRGIVYRHDDAQSLATFAAATFDGATCCLALMDIPDLAACLRSVRRVLKPGGWFVFAMTHPCCQVPEGRWTGQAGGTIRREIRGYFREGFWKSNNPYGVRGQVGAYHRTLETYLNALNDAGLTLERVAEPQPLDAVAARVPGYAEAPAMFAARCTTSLSGPA